MEHIINKVWYIKVFLCKLLNLAFLLLLSFSLTFVNFENLSVQRVLVGWCIKYTYILWGLTSESIVRDKMMKIRAIFKRCLRPVVFLIYTLVLLVLIPLLVLQAINDGTKKSSSAYTIAGIFVLMAVPISIWEIVMHTLHYTKPKLQKYIIRYVFWNTSLALHFVPAPITSFMKTIILCT